jgi:DNA replication initiation complex subunit (GINS family)
MSHTNLFVYYQKIFGMAQHHKYSIAEIENLLPYERDLYFEMLIEFIESQREKERAR